MATEDAKEYEYGGVKDSIAKWRKLTNIEIKEEFAKHTITQVIRSYWLRCLGH